MIAASSKPRFVAAMAGGPKPRMHIVRRNGNAYLDLETAAGTVIFPIQDGPEIRSAVQGWNRGFGHPEAAAAV